VATTAPIPTPNAVDLHGLERLRHRAANEDPAALAEAAVQFEALFIGMMLDSARNARLGSGMLDGPQTDQYFKLMDQQVALELARSGGFGFGRMLTEQLVARGDVAEPAESSGARPAGLSRSGVRAMPPPPVGGAAEFPAGLPASLATLGAAQSGVERSTPPSADSFVQRFLPEAQAAAAELGVEPRLLLAQAALETGWGGALERPDAPANNLFGIKADSSWRGERAAHWTMEQGSAGLERKREEFRAYGDAAASFADYVDLIANTPRYAPAVASANDPEAYARAVAAAGYATDPAYADKWLSIYNGERLGNALRNVAPLASE
jgi:flagellar protein FlgJ